MGSTGFPLRDINTFAPLLFTPFPLPLSLIFQRITQNGIKVHKFLNRRFEIQGTDFQMISKNVVYLKDTFHCTLENMKRHLAICSPFLLECIAPPYKLLDVCAAHKCKAVVGDK